MRRAFFLFLSASLLAGCSDACQNTVVDQKRAPDDRHFVVMFQRDCGATTGFSTQLSVLEDGEQPTGSGNAFRADDDHGAARAGGWGGPWAETRWLAADHLLVRYAAKSRIFRQADQVDGVKITFAATTP